MSSDQFTEHLSDYHVKEQCEHCGAQVWGAVGLSEHLESCHAALTCLPNIAPPTPGVPPSTPSAQEMTQSLTLQDQLHPAPACLPAQEMTPDIYPKDAPAPTTAPETPSNTALLPAPASAPPPAAPAPPLGRARFLPKAFLRVIKPGDQEWIAHILYEASGQLKQDVGQNWHHPSSPIRSTAPPDPHDYFRQRMFLWAPMRM